MNDYKYLGDEVEVIKFKRLEKTQNSEKYIEMKN